MSSNKIRIIYQYSRRNLLNILEKEFKNIDEAENYLEKYIETNVNLTDVNLFDLIKFKYELSENKYEKYFSFDYILKLYIALEQFSVSNNQNLIDRKLINPRRVEKFLRSIYTHLKNNQDDKEQDILTITTVGFYFIKYFLPKSYAEIDLNKDLEEIFKFEYEKKIYTYSELEIRILEDEKFYKKENNLTNLLIFKILDYKKTERLLNISIKNEYNIYNKKINRRFKNLYASGLTQFTEEENYASKFKEEVLDYDKQEWNEKYRDFNIKYENNKEFQIFFMGASKAVSIFRAFYFIEPSEEVWIKLIDFLEMRQLFKELDSEFFEAISFLDLSNVNVRLRVSQIIVGLDVVGNLNSNDYFFLFLERYYRDWRYLNEGLIELLIFEQDKIKDEENFSLINKLSNKYIERLEKLKKKEVTRILDIEEEINLTIEVTNKIIEVITSKSSATSSYRISTNIDYRKTGEVKELEEYLQFKDINKFEQNAREYYYNNKVSKSTIHNLIKEYYTEK